MVAKSFLFVTFVTLACFWFVVVVDMVASKQSRGKYEDLRYEDRT